MNNLPETGMRWPCHTQILYKEVHDGVDFAMVVVAVVETGDDYLGRIYIMNSHAHDAATDTTLRDDVEVIQAASDAEAQRIGIGLFDSLMRELGEGPPPQPAPCAIDSAMDKINQSLVRLNTFGEWEEINQQK